MSKALLAALLAIGLSVAVFPVAYATAQQNERDDELCQDTLGALKRVDPAELAGITNPQRVWVTEYCVNHPILPSEGNAAGRRAAIADNEALVKALRQKGYRPADVYAIKMMGADTVTLYVHR